MPSTRPFCCSWVPRCWISWCIWTRSSNVVGICSGSWIGFENPEHDKLHHPHLWAKWLSCCPLVWRWYWRKSAMEDRYHHTVPHVVDHRWYNCTQERCPHTTLQTKETIVAHWCHHEIQACQRECQIQVQRSCDAADSRMVDFLSVEWNLRALKNISTSSHTPEIYAHVPWGNRQSAIVSQRTRWINAWIFGKRTLGVIPCGCGGA